MRRILFVAASAATLMAATAGANAMTLNAGSTVRTAAGAIDPIEDVRRVCREVCRDGFCRQRCYEDDNVGYRERRVYREYESSPRVYYDRPHYYEPAPSVGIYGPGVGLYGPGVGIELGPRW